jgi:crotonobetainyl-CoA:carnitine CoA-transferase CaiB-like acyl-CoA transferase
VDIRIIDLTSMLSGPWATMILGDQGTDVLAQNFRPGVVERQTLGG